MPASEVVCPVATMDGAKASVCAHGLRGVCGECCVIRWDWVDDRQLNDLIQQAALFCYAGDGSKLVPALASASVTWDAFHIDLITERKRRDILRSFHGNSHSNTATA